MWQMGRSNTCAWPEVANEVGCHRAGEGWGSRGPQGGRSESCQGACQAGGTPGGGSDKEIRDSLQNPGTEKSVIGKYAVLIVEGDLLLARSRYFKSCLPSRYNQNEDVNWWQLCNAAVEQIHGL